MEKSNNKLVILLLSIIIVILAVLCALFATGKISLNFTEKTNDNVNEGNNNSNATGSIVTVKSFDIEDAKVVNNPNNHMYVTGKFVLEGNEDDYSNVGFSGYCYDMDNNMYKIHAPGIAGHKYVIGENELDAAEAQENDYGKLYNLYVNDPSNADSGIKPWKDITFKSCKFDKMQIVYEKEGKLFELYENINFEKEF